MTSNKAIVPQVSASRRWRCIATALRLLDNPVILDNLDGMATSVVRKERKRLSVRYVYGAAFGLGKKSSTPDSAVTVLRHEGGKSVGRKVNATRAKPLSMVTVRAIQGIASDLGVQEGKVVIDLERFREYLRAGAQPLEPDAGDWVQRLKAAKGGAYSSAELERHLNVTRQALADRRSSFSIVYWTDPHGRCWYPKWQFDHELKVLPAVKEVLKALRSEDTVKVLATFLVPASGLGDRSVLDLILSGQTDEALSHVHSLGGRR